MLKYADRPHTVFRCFVHDRLSNYLMVERYAHFISQQGDLEEFKNK